MTGLDETNETKRRSIRQDRKRQDEKFIFAVDTDARDEARECQLKKCG